VETFGSVLEAFGLYNVQNRKNAGILPLKRRHTGTCQTNHTGENAGISFPNLYLFALFIDQKKGMAHNR
jgi:hypothetical protein